MEAGDAIAAKIRQAEKFRKTLFDENDNPIEDEFLLGLIYAWETVTGQDWEE